jgi:hypothetical protein
MPGPERIARAILRGIERKAKSRAEQAELLERQVAALVAQRKACGGPAHPERCGCRATLELQDLITAEKAKIAPVLPGMERAP